MLWPPLTKWKGRKEKKKKINVTITKTKQTINILKALTSSKWGKQKELIISTLDTSYYFCNFFTPSLHLHQSATSSFFKPILLMLPSTCFLHLIFSPPCLCFPSTYVLFPSSKHLPQVVSKHDHTTSHHLLLPAYLLLPSIPTCPSAPLYFSCLPTLHCTYHRSFCSS